MPPLAGLLKAKLVDAAAHDAATSNLNLVPAPTEAQAEAGNYRKGHTRISGLAVAIENPAGSRRRPEWPAMQAHYGYIKRTEGADGDAVDVFIRPGTPNDWAGTVFVVDQTDGAGGFDEHKVLLGFDSEQQAVHTYSEHYPAGWEVGKVTALPFDEFKAWLTDGDTTQPLAKALFRQDEVLARAARCVSQAELLAALLRKDGGASASAGAAPASGGWTASTSPTSGVTAYGDTGSAPRKRRKVKLVPQKQT